MMNKSLLALAAGLAISTLSGVAHAEDAAAAPAASPLTFNAGLVTDYRYRGISQSRLGPALQGGADYAGPNGLYVGTWASSILWIKDATGGTDLEWDLYGGWKGEVAKGLTLDAGLLSYVYVDNKLPTSANTTEIYGALTYDIFTAKYSHSLTNLFGFANSKNSGYLDLSAAFDLGSGYSLTPHIGHQTVSGNGDYSYTDYALTLGKDFGNGLSASLAVIGTDAKKDLGGVPAYFSPASDGYKNLGRAGLVAGLKYSF
jgi:uncharacterized protein (TIGR02001 family)